MAAIPVFLADPDPDWPRQAARHMRALKGALGPALHSIHHIGSTAVPGLAAKPVIDLAPLVWSLEALEARRGAVEALGYEWLGAFGIPGRRYFRLTDGRGRRRVHAHAFEWRSPGAVRHLAFRDWLRAHPEQAQAYAAEKRRARDLHPGDSTAYTDEKAAWVRAAEAEALAWFARNGAGRHTGANAE